jgi:hypothetical protein
MSLDCKDNSVGMFSFRLAPYRNRSTFSHIVQAQTSPIITDISISRVAFQLVLARVSGGPGWGGVKNAL